MTMNERHAALIDYVTQDSLFKDIFHTLHDYGYRIRFSNFGGAGAYQPFSLSTEKIDTPEKQAQFTNGFWSMVEQNHMRAEFKLSKRLGLHGNAHSLLHEMMHFYQDLHGLYLIPLKEEKTLPVMLDAKSEIDSVLFNEAWAQTEAIRASWALAQKGSNLGWLGATTSPDWKKLATSYDQDLQNGADETKAAARTFTRWYEHKNRAFYEHAALKMQRVNFKRLSADVNTGNIKEKLRTLKIPELIRRIPEDQCPQFFKHIDWNNALFSQAHSSKARRFIEAFQRSYGHTENDKIQDIKCGAPPYLWNRLRLDAQLNADHPPMSFSDYQNIGEK